MLMIDISQMKLVLIRLEKDALDQPISLQRETNQILLFFNFLIGTIIFQFIFDWNAFPQGQLAIWPYGLDSGLVPNRRRAITWTHH